MPFELNCDYYLLASYIKEINSCPQLKLVDKLAIILKQLIIIYIENL